MSYTACWVPLLVQCVSAGRPCYFSFVVKCKGRVIPFLYIQNARDETGNRKTPPPPGIPENLTPSSPLDPLPMPRGLGSGTEVNCPRGLLGFPYVVLRHGAHPYAVGWVSHGHRHWVLYIFMYSCTHASHIYLFGVSCIPYAAVVVLHVHIYCWSVFLRSESVAGHSKAGGSCSSQRAIPVPGFSCCWHQSRDSGLLSPITHSLRLHERPFDT